MYVHEYQFFYSRACLYITYDKIHVIVIVITFFHLLPVAPFTNMV